MRTEARCAAQEFVQFRIPARRLMHPQSCEGGAGKLDPAVLVQLQVSAARDNQCEFGRLKVDARTLPDFDPQTVIQLRLFRDPVFALPFQDLPRVGVR